MSRVRQIPILLLSSLNTKSPTTWHTPSLAFVRSNSLLGFPCQTSSTRWSCPLTGLPQPPEVRSGRTALYPILVSQSRSLMAVLSFSYESVPKGPWRPTLSWYQLNPFDSGWKVQRESQLLTLTSTSTGLLSRKGKGSRLDHMSWLSATFRKGRPLLSYCGYPRLKSYN
jgi:hypothetical protein